MEDLIERLRLGDGTSPDHQLLIEAAVAIEKLYVELGQAPEIQRMLMAENKELKEGLDGWHSRYLDVQTELDRYMDQGAVMLGDLETVKAENAALRADAELKYTAWQSPHNDDLWLEHPADCEIIDNFHPPVHVGFEYELTAGSYTTQRYRVVKIADAESDDVLVELIAGEKHD